ncbi:MAG: PAS domain S-box protein [Acidimicrobiia bacterium]
MGDKDRNVSRSTAPPPGAAGSGRIWRRLSPTVIAGTYAVVGLLWIVTSDFLLASIGVEGIDFNLSLVKGIGYVLVTGGLLFITLRRREEWVTAARQELTRWVGDTPQLDPDEQIRVLIVDGDPHHRQLIKDAILSAVGFFDVDEASNAAEGRKALLAGIHDVILIDHLLPGGSGIDLISELHEVASGPMILVTTTDDPEVDRRAMEAGAHDNLLKHEIQASWIGRTLRYAVANWRGQREVARTRRWYAEIVHESPIGLFRSTPEGGLTEGNPALLSIFGAPNIDDIRQRGLGPLYRNPSDRERLVRRVSEGETLEDEDIEMQRLDGTPIAVRMRMRGISDDDGLISLYGALIDVTALLASESRIRTQASMLDQVRNAVVRTDPDGLITYWNKASESTFGWSAEEVLGRQVLKITPAPSERDRGAEIKAEMSRTGSWEGEYRCRRKDGTEFPAYVSNSVLTSPTGEMTGFVGITVDLTELEMAKERAASQEAMATSVLETVHFPAAVLDSEGVIIAVNGAWTESAIANGALLAAVGVGVSYLDVCDRSGVPDAIAAGAGIRAVIAGQESRFTHEYLSGTQWFRLEVAQAVKPLGGAVAMHIDITDLRQAAIQAEEFARSKDRLIASVSHELRTPLTAVLGFAGLIENPKGLEPEEITQFASMIHRQATDMAAIVEDLLVAARAEMGALTVQITSVDLNIQINEVIGHFNHHSTATIEYASAEMPMVRADPLRLRQVLRNLVNNAVRYGGERVRVATVTSAEHVAVRVSDDGEGVPSHLADAIFEPFFSAHDRRGQPDSLGLGLSVVRTLTEAMGGTVGLTAEDGWTVFTVALARADA